jgi:hypothetical protein
MAKGIIARDNVAESFKNCNVELFYATLIKIIERKENVKIEYTLEKRKKDDITM